MSAHRLALVAALFAVPALAAQPGSTYDTLLTAPMLKRLGEAVDGYRTGHAYWVVMRRTPPHHVRGVFRSADSASAALRSAGAGYATFGPYVAPTDPGNELVLYSIAPCPGRHRWDSECPEETRRYARVNVRDVDSVVVSIHWRRGGEPDVQRHTFNPYGVDALFFTLAAIDKFVVPYYERLYGVEYAAGIRQRYLRSLRGAP